MKTAVVKTGPLARMLASATTPEAVLEAEAKIAAAEEYLRKTNLYTTEQIRPIHEMRMRARWKLGRLLSAIERKTGPGRGKKILRAANSFGDFLKKIKMSAPLAMQCQRIGAMPEKELDAIFMQARKDDVLLTYDGLIDRARPWWQKESRERKHRHIVQNAKRASKGPKTIEMRGGEVVAVHEHVGPFVLIYADPPTPFETFSEAGKERSPEAHYPTLSFQDIAEFRVGTQTIDEIAHEDAVLALWCTSSNIVHALWVMEQWGFEYKTQLVWDKEIMGTGHIFRNQHEILLYGTRGNFPAPELKPVSVYRERRVRHSQKPEYIRVMLEQMFPQLDASTRIELFARGVVSGWTTHGYEADVSSAE